MSQHIYRRISERPSRSHTRRSEDDNADSDDPYAASPVGMFPGESIAAAFAADDLKTARTSDSCVAQDDYFTEIVTSDPIPWHPGGGGSGMREGSVFDELRRSLQRLNIFPQSSGPFESILSEHTAHYDSDSDSENDSDATLADPSLDLPDDKPGTWSPTSGKAPLLDDVTTVRYQATTADDFDSSDDEEDEKGKLPGLSRRLPPTPQQSHDNKLFLLKFAQTLLIFGAPAHRIRFQLRHLAKYLGTPIQVINFPWVIATFFRNPRTHGCDLHLVEAKEGLSLGRLRELGDIYRNVMESGQADPRKLDELIQQPPVYSRQWQCIFAFLSTMFFCPIAFGGSVIDSVVSGFLGTAMVATQLIVGCKNQMYANIVDFCMVSLVSMVCRGLSIIPYGDSSSSGGSNGSGDDAGRLFCYTALSSATIASLLPGWLILTAGLEIASKQPTSGSMRLVYGLIYALILGMGIQIGSDVVLAFQPSERIRLHDLQQSLAGKYVLPGNLTILREGVMGIATGGEGGEVSSAFESFFSGEWVFSTINEEGPRGHHGGMGVPAIVADTLTGACMRNPKSPWWMNTLPWWSSFILVPITAGVTCLQYEQPWRGWETQSHSGSGRRMKRVGRWDLPVMIIVSSLAFATNHVAIALLKDRKDLIAGVSAFVIGFIGNVYARMRPSSSGYTTMLAGVLFLVPSVFGESGGITIDGGSLDIGADILDLTIGTTVGLFIAKGVTQIRLGYGAPKTQATQGQLHY